MIHADKDEQSGGELEVRGRLIWTVSSWLLSHTQIIHRSETEMFIYLLVLY